MSIAGARAVTLSAVIALAAFAVAVTTPATAQAQELENATVLQSGTFKGRSGHATSGTVRVVEQDGRTFVVLSKDFRFDGAPDPKLGFSRDRRKPKRLFSPLRSDRGEQIYELPSSVDASSLDGLNLWCERFGVQLGYADFG